MWELSTNLQVGLRVVRRGARRYLWAYSAGAFVQTWRLCQWEVSRCGFGLISHGPGLRVTVLDSALVPSRSAVHPASTRTVPPVQRSYIECDATRIGNGTLGPVCSLHWQDCSHYGSKRILKDPEYILRAAFN
jgi:hypothetical protein